MRRIVLGFLCSLILPAIAGSAAHAFISAPPQTTYHFSGVCAPNDCIGTGEADLVVQNYIAGLPLSITNFVSFSYHSSIFDPGFTWAPGDISGFTGVLDAPGQPLPGAADVTITSDLYSLVFSSLDDGSWSLFFTNVCSSPVEGSGPLLCSVFVADFGPTSEWNAAPEPASLALFGAGLLGLFAACRRRA